MTSSSDGWPCCPVCKQAPRCMSGCPWAAQQTRIAALEAEVVKMSTALGLVVGRVFPQFEDPEVAKVLARMESK